MTVAQIAEFVARQPEIDAIIVRAPTWGIQPSTVKQALNAAEIISRIPEQYGKPVIATALRRERSGVVYELMRERNIPLYEFPEEAARAIYGLYSYSRVSRRAS
jgi:acyl-CoA synthetase (NDP forming)